MKTEEQNMKMTVEDNAAGTAVIPLDTPRRFRFEAPEIETEKISKRKPLVVSFHVGKQFIQSMLIPQEDKRKKPVQIIFAKPTLAEFAPGELPTENNPRSHPTECAKSDLAKKIEETLMNSPEEFLFANRGACIICEHFEYDSKTGEAKIFIVDPEIHGIADGATSSIVIDKVQKTLTDGKGIREATEIPEQLLTARFNLEIIVGMEDKDLIATLVEGRNSSRQVKQFSLADFRGEYDWIKSILDAKDSPFQGKVGYDENYTENVSILDVLAILNALHPEYDKEGESEAPIISYSGKSRLVERLKNTEVAQGFENLTPIALDVFRLYDYIHVHFADAYDRAQQGESKLGRRVGIKSFVNKPNKYKTPFTEDSSEYHIPKSYLLPLLSAFRALVSYGKRGEAKGLARWKTNPFEFFDRHGPALIRELIKQIDVYKNPNTAAKKPNVWDSMHKEAQLLLVKDSERALAA